MKLKKGLKEAKEVAKELPKSVIAVGAALLLLAGFLKFHVPKNDPRAASVMITNRAMNSGGTGIIYRSYGSRSEVLTNAHVCRILEKGGVVKSSSGVFQVLSYSPSTNSDLCMVTVATDLGIDTYLSNNMPKFYDYIFVSGHPALFPNVVTEGHLSGRDILPVLVGIRPCTEEDLNSDKALLCMFLGGIPIVKTYESVLVTATIMPGSSGSGVYNKKNELIGVVFAGSGELGYAWTVPYEQVRAFLYKEYPKLKPTYVSQELDLFGSKEEARNNVKQKCAINTNVSLNPYCDIINHDILWRR